ncbi:hypothetical protein DFH09DRAFT_1109285 [Mycena vulgaris]|nr:hypothetical protein DFH09DRAFT_1109285 [Mycena vulgaris]
MPWLGALLHCGCHGGVGYGLWTTLVCRPWKGSLGLHVQNMKIPNDRNDRNALDMTTRKVLEMYWTVIQLEYTIICDKLDFIVTIVDMDARRGTSARQRRVSARQYRVSAASMRGSATATQPPGKVPRTI